MFTNNILMSLKYIMKLCNYSLININIKYNIRAKYRFEYNFDDSF